MKDINDILAAYFSGEISEEDKVRLHEWKATHEEEFAQLSAAWETTLTFNAKDLPAEPFDAKKALEKIEPQLEPKVDSDTKVIKLKFYKQVAAACAILLVGLAGMWFLNRNGNGQEIANADHSPQEINLPDGSTIWLGSNSTVEYASNFTLNRAVTLQGEAFFDIAKDAEHPFIITTGLGEVEVLGTAFNVDASGTATVVSVERGKVELRNENGEVQLTKGQSAFATSASISDVKEVDKNYLSWKTGNFVFENTPLDEVVMLLNKYYDKTVELEMKTGDTQTTPTFNGTFNNEALSTVIEAIVLTCNVQAEYGEDQIQLK